MLQDNSIVQIWSSLKVRRHVNHLLQEFQEVVVMLMLHPNKPKKDNIESDTPCARGGGQNMEVSTQCHLDFFHRVWTIFPFVTYSELFHWIHVSQILADIATNFCLTKRSGQVHSRNARTIGSSRGSTAIQCTHCTLDKEIPTSISMRSWKHTYCLLFVDL